MKELFIQLSNHFNLFGVGRFVYEKGAPEVHAGGAEQPEHEPSEFDVAEAQQRGREILESFKNEWIRQQSGDESVINEQEADALSYEEANRYLGFIPGRLKTWKTTLERQMTAEKDPVKQREIFMQSINLLRQQDQINTKLYQKFLPDFQKNNVAQNELNKVIRNLNTFGQVLDEYVKEMLHAQYDAEQGYLGAWKEMDKADFDKAVQTIAELTQNGQISLDRFADFEIAKSEGMGESGLRYRAAYELSQALPSETQGALADLGILQLRPEFLDVQQDVKKLVLKTKDIQNTMQDFIGTITSRPEVSRLKEEVSRLKEEVRVALNPKEKNRLQKEVNSRQAELNNLLKVIRTAFNQLDNHDESLKFIYVYNLRIKEGKPGDFAGAKNDFVDDICEELAANNTDKPVLLAALGYTPEEAIALAEPEAPEVTEEKVATRTKKLKQ